MTLDRPSASTPRIVATVDNRADDLALLRRFEPVLRLTQGEMFVPVSVEAYLRGAALIADAGAPTERVLAEHGALDPQVLAAMGSAHVGPELSLRYVERPMGRGTFRRWLRDGGRPPFAPTSTAVAVGLFARVVAALIRLTLLLRGKVPARWTAAAVEQTRAFLEPGAAPTYYGHVTRDAGYVVLQYWFLYPMNDWRSSFGGVNDHEADWEQITIFLVRESADRALRAAWVAFSSHDEVGADLRRRWDDPDLARLGEHPVVYVGAGSHSGAYLPGEYLVTVAPDLPGWLESARRKIARILPWWEPGRGGIGIPYLDYRRGDGPAIGPGERLAWDARLIDDTTPWVRDYRGLWGLDTGDPLGGERAPAGPRYERDGRVRASWGQPVAWAALDGVPPTREEAESAWVAWPDRLRAALDALDGELATARDDLRGVAVADRATGGPHHSASDAAIRVEKLRRTQARLRENLDLAQRHHLDPVPADGVHDHLRHRTVPLGATQRRGSALIRGWAAASSVLLLAALGVILLTGTSNLAAPVVGVLVAMLLVEALLRGRLIGLVVRMALALAIALAAWRLAEFVLDHVREAAGIALLLAAAYLLGQVVRDALLGAAAQARVPGGDGAG